MELAVNSRTILGKKVKNLRKEGLIPGELYGHNILNHHISINKKDFTKVYRDSGENTIITVIIDKNEKVPALIANVEYNQISDQVISIDLRQIRMDEKITAQVPVILNGDALAVKSGFVIIKVHNEISVESLPDKIPHEFAIDISKLENPGDSISVKNIPEVNGVKILTPSDTVVVIVQEKAKEEVVVPAPTATAVSEPTATTEGETGTKQEKTTPMETGKEKKQTK